MSRRILLLALALAPAAWGQLQVSVSVNGKSNPVSAGGSVSLSAIGINQPVNATVTLTNSGSADASITGISLAGTTEMTVQSGPALPVAVAAGTSTSFAVQYMPVSGGPVTSQVTIAYTQNTQTSSFQFSFTGTTPRLTFNYSFPPSTNLIALNAGDTIAFAATNVGSSVTATVNILNSGSGAGSLTSASVTGTGFQVSAATPLAIPAGQQASVNVTFSPQTATTVQGSLTLTFPSGSVSFALAGNGTSPSLSATYALADGNVHAFPNGVTITFPTVDINGNTSASITVSNTGTGSGTVSAISLTGAGFQLAGLPALPATVGSNQSLTFRVVFSPTQSGTFTGTLQIAWTGGGVSGNLSASTSPSNINLAYLDPSTSSTLPLQNNSTLPFPNTQLGSVTNISVLAINSGTGTGFINSIALSGASASAFQLLSLPVLPVAVAPNQQLTFGVRFIPQQPQSYPATLTVTINGQPVVINITAQGTGAQFTYSQSTSSGTTPLAAGGTIAVAATNVGQTSSVALSVANSGNASGQIASITVNGQGLSLSGLPAFPLTLTPGASQQFTLNFTPTQSGSVSGQLTIGGAIFTVTATANGAPPSFAVTYLLSDGNVRTLTSGGTIAFPSVDINGSTTATVTVTNNAGGSGSVTAISVSGTGFQVSGLPALPATVAAGQSLSFRIIFSPAQSGSFSGTVAISYTNGSITASLAGSTTTSNISLAYTDPATNSTIALANNSALPFPNTALGSTTTISVLAINSGSGTGTVNSVALGGTSASSFQLLNLPALPANVPPNQQLAFGIRFSPQQPQTYSATLTITVNGQPVVINISAQGTGAQFAYMQSTATSSAPLAPGGTIAIGATNAGQTSSVTITVTNNGNASGQIAMIGVTGQGLSVTGLPGLPATVAPNASLQFTLNFAPTQSGAVTGQLTVGNAGFTVTATGNGTQSNFAVTYALADGNVHTLSAGTTISFPSVDINGNTAATITVTNQGGSTGSVTAISITGTGFQLSGLPALPATLAANQSLSFRIVFTPTQSGNFTGTFGINYTNGSLSASLAGSTASSNVTLAYTDASTSSTISLANNATVPFPNTAVGSSATVTMLVINTGAGTAVINSIALNGVSGTVFQLLNLPVFPANLPPNQQLSFGVRFTPPQLQPYTASLAVTVNGQATTVNLSALGNGPQYTYLFTSNGTTTGIAAGGTITIPNTTVGQTTSATIQVTNNGNASGQIPGIAVTGAQLSVTNLPGLPLTLASGAAAQFTLSFAPTQANQVTGQLSIGSATFIVSATGVAAQPSFSFSYALADGNVHALTSGATISFPAVDINASATATITITNTGGGSGNISSISVNGTAFQTSGVPALPATIAANQTLRFGIVFAPTQTGTFTGSFQVTYDNGSLSGSLTASTAPSNISLAYIDPATNNTLALANNGALPFPNTLVGASMTISVLAPNHGTGTGSITAVSLTGAPDGVFQLVNLPPFPLSVPPSQQATFAVRFTPPQQQAYSATLAVTANGQPLTVSISATGTGPQYSYTLTTASGTTAVLSGGTISMASVNVGQTSNVTVTVTNNGSGNGQIAGIGVTGQGLSLTSLPPFPVTLAPNASAQFTLNFAPTQPGAVNGQLTIGGVQFPVTATGIGSQLVYTYANSAGSSSVAPGGAVIFTPLAVGSTESISFTVQNTGTSSATISSINVASSSSIFSLQQVPALPLSLAPGASVGFSASFAPNNTGSLTATLAIDTTTFVLSGTGTPPPALPSYQFQGAGGTLSAAQQPAIGLTLASPYPLALQGSLTLTFVSDVFANDPSVQFANGGRTVNFTIPANATQAVFDGNNTTVSLQSGTTAGSIVITPAFATQGGFNLTPTSATPLTLTVPHSAPVLTNASITSVTASSFILVLNGYSTTRVLSEFDVQFTPASGTSLTASSVTINVSTPSASWFQSATSQGFGGSFVVQVPFTLTGGAANTNLVSLLQSLSITAKNDVGTSKAVSVGVP